MQFGNMDSPEVIKICKCSEFKDVEAQPGCIKIGLEGRVFAIKLKQKRMEVLDIQTLIKKQKSAAAIGKEYHTSQKIKIRRNIDSLFYKYETKQLKIAEIAGNEFQSCLLENKDHIMHEFKKNLVCLKNFREISSCFEVKKKATGFRDQFVSIIPFLCQALNIRLRIKVDPNSLQLEVIYN